VVDLKKITKLEYLGRQCRHSTKLKDKKRFA
jgi:hypothetical protein